MRSMFHKASAFNGNISSWNMSSVTDMNHMFYGASSFNQTFVHGRITLSFLRQCKWNLCGFWLHISRSR
jgi:surface protein